LQSGDGSPEPRVGSGPNKNDKRVKRDASTTGERSNLLVILSKGSLRGEDPGEPRDVQGPFATP